MTRVLVTDGDQRPALAVVRALGKAGYHVTVASVREGALAAASRYCSDRVLVPDPLVAPTEFANRILELIRGEDCAVVLPISEPSLLALLPHRDTLGSARMPFPALEVFSRVCDKSFVLNAADRIGLATPRQTTISDATDLSGVAGVRFPCVLKPARSVGEHAGQRHKHGVMYARSLDDLQAQVRALAPSAFPVLVQERIDGPGMGVFILRWKGQTRASMTHRRLREHPPSGGVSTYCECIADDPALTATCEQLLDNLGFEGPAMVEFKVDHATGIPYLMEINGRLWGSLRLAIDAGVNFPVMLVELACGVEPVRPKPRVGTRYRWLLGDIDQLAATLLKSRAALRVPETFPSRWRSLWMVLRVRRNESWDTFMWSDARPFFREMHIWASALARAARRRLFTPAPDAQRESRRA